MSEVKTERHGWKLVGHLALLLRVWPVGIGIHSKNRVSVREKSSVTRRTRTTGVRPTSGTEWAG